MRSGGSAVQQTLTTEAASVLKLSLNLARRRGHAQVTPLHVASTLLTCSTTSLLRRACFKSNHNHHHHLQSRALELCFNVALNRLPTTPTPLLHGHPSLSNALIAALKRAQAHQRRGYNSLEQQQQQITNTNTHNQPLLTIKVELEQLVISILDDPSVSRVMREAGFSSTAVKNNVEDFSSASSVFNCYTASAGVFSSPSSPSPSPTETLNHPYPNPNFWKTHFLTYSSEQNPLFISPQKKLISSDQYYSPSAASSVNNISNIIKEDIKLVFEVLLSKNNKKKKNTVIVGDSVSITEGLVSELMGRLERRDVPEELKQTHFIKFQFAPVTLRFMKKEDVEIQLDGLKRKLDYCYSPASSSSGSGTGAIIYTGDLKWTVDNDDQVEGKIPCYSAVNNLVSEIGKLVSENSKVWIVATASYQTYRRCQMRNPSLEIQWGLQPVSVPSGGLGLSLHSSSGNDLRLKFGQNPSQEMERKPFSNNEEEEEDKLECCAECVSNYENESQLLKSEQQKLLPPWLQSHSLSNSTQKDELVKLRKKWNRLCQNLHPGIRRNSQTQSNTFNNSGKSFSYAFCSYPWWPSHRSNIGALPESNSSTISFMESTPLMCSNSHSSSVAKFRRQQSCTIEFDFNSKINGRGDPIISLDSLKNKSESKEDKITLALGNSIAKSGFSERYEHLFLQFQENISPWKCDEENMISVKEALVEFSSDKKEITWLMIEGNDTIGKRRFALAIAESGLGSSDFLLRIDMMKDQDTASASENIRNGLNKHGKLVVLIEEINMANAQFTKFLLDAFQSGKLGESSTDETTGKIMFILTRGDSSNYENSNFSVINLNLKFDDSLKSHDLKRKSQWEFQSKKIKSPRFAKGEDEDEERVKLSRQSSFNSTPLDLNIKADEEEEEFSPIQSNSTRETPKRSLKSNGFPDSIKNRLILDRNPTTDEEIKGFYLSRFTESFEEVFEGETKNNRVKFRVEERVLQELSMGSGVFVNSWFEKWVKEVFKTSLETVKIGGFKEGGIVKVRLCFGGKSENILEDGFKDTCLPKKIQFSVIE